MKKIMRSQIPKVIFYLIITACANNAFSQKVRDAKIKVSSSAPDASITVNGRAAGNGGAEVKLLANSCMKISAQKEGFYAKSVEFCNNGFTFICFCHLTL